MINVGRELDILFNTKNFSCLKLLKCMRLTLSSFRLVTVIFRLIQWSNNIKYLGLNFCSGKCFTVDTSSTIRKLYAAANAVFSHTNRVTTHLENLEKSGNSKVVREKSGKMEKVSDKSREVKSSVFFKL